MDSLSCLITFGLWAAATVGIAWQRIRAEANAAADERDRAIVRDARLTGIAYAWPHDRSDDELLALLVALNRERAEAEQGNSARYPNRFKWASHPTRQST
jgi:hypothetical protein